MLRPRLQPMLEWLKERFPEARMLVVGGAVRDWTISREGAGPPGKDVDLEVIGVEEAVLAEALPWPQKTVGRSFSHWLVQLDHQWMELSVEPEPLREPLAEHWARLARRRDFSCNAMAWEPLSDRVFDPFGGAQDIARRRLRQAAPDSLRQDPLRIWRAAQFCARFGWEVEAETESAIRREVSRLGELPAERVTREWDKLCRLAEQPSLALELLDRWGVIQAGYPELWDLHGCPQDPVHHPEGDVWIHTMLVIDQAARLARLHDLSEQEKLVLVLAGLLHDVGKPATTVVEAGRVRALGHERAGQGPATAWLSRHRFGEEIGLAVLDCVVQHMRPALLAREIAAGSLSPAQQVNALRRLVRDLRQISFPLFLLLCEADKRGRGSPGEGSQGEWEPARLLQDLYHSHPVLQSAAEPLLRGRDLLALGLAPGKELGQWLRRAEEARDEGLFADREGALAWLRERLGI